jgi:hypothetical protein
MQRGYAVELEKGGHAVGRLEKKKNGPYYSYMMYWAVQLLALFLLVVVVVVGK